MNPLYEDILKTLIFIIIFVCFIVLLISMVRSKKREESIKQKAFLMVIDVIAFLCTLVFVLSHSTYYKYNDWWILASDIHSVQERYGEFDKGRIEDGKSGCVAYFIYHDYGPVMPDNLDHFYYIYYDECGLVNKVEERMSEGG